MATTSYDNTIKLWRVPYLTLLRSIPAQSKLVYTLAFSPDHQVLASGGWDGAVKLWEFPRGTLDRVVKAHDNLVQAVAFAPNGRWLASGSTDCRVKLWRVGDWSMACELHQP